MNPDQGAHLTPEQLDDLAAQASAERDPDHRDEPDDTDAQLHAHLATCPACRSALGDQVEVSAWLRRAPTPAPMPADVVTRLDAALAGAAAARTGRSATAGSTADGTAPSGVDLEHPGTVLPLTPRDEHTGRLGRLAESRLAKSLVAAAAVLLIAGGTFAAIHRNSSDATTAGGASSASGGAAGDAAVPSAAGGPIQVRQSGTAYTTNNVSAEVRKQLAQPNPVAAAVPQAAGDAKSTLLTPAGLKACLAALQAPGAVPSLVDIATYNGKPAAVLVLPDTDGTSDIWVVAPTCGPNADGTMLFKKLA